MFRPLAAAALAVALAACAGTQKKGAAPVDEGARAEANDRARSAVPEGGPTPPSTKNDSVTAHGSW